MTTHKERQIFESLVDQEYRKAFRNDIGTGIAFQVRAMRDARHWTQEEFAQRLNNHQATVSRWEDPNYGRYSLRTLKELADAFDVGLLN